MKTTGINIPLFLITLRDNITSVANTAPLCQAKKETRLPALLYVAGLGLLCSLPQLAGSQTCPPNIDFESGTFDNWTCYTGRTTAFDFQNQINLYPTGPTPDSHALIKANSGQVDKFGGFPVNCPNGSGYSVKLGNERGGGEAEGISYEFTIPTGKNEYSLIYHYAVVFQDPVHEIYQQPRMVVEVTNVTDNALITCSSFSFVPFGSILPGFFESPVRVGDGTPVWCKDWSAVSVNLDGLAGKTIRLFFKTADCTFRRHFGYAYIDVNSECSSEFVGAAFCPDDTAVNVTAPFGYQNYKWFNSNFTRVLGDQQTIRFFPPPSSGTTLAVEVVPYNGYGCVDTFYARLLDTLTVHALAGPDRLYCGDTAVQLGENPKPGLIYSWSPANGLNNPEIANPLASPGTVQTYTLSVRNSGGGCLSTDIVVVQSSSIDSALQLIGKDVFCLGNDDSAVLLVKPTNQIQWYRNDVPIGAAVASRYRVTQSGDYAASLANDLGCRLKTRTQTVFIDQAKPAIRYPVQYAETNMPQPIQARSFGESVLWDPAVFLNDPALLRPSFTGDEDQLYTIRIETNTGCVTIDTQLVKVVPRADIFVPTAFTPNQDGKNDLLRPVLMGMKELVYFRVFNRWGELVYETKTPFEGWNGMFRGKPLPPETVVWIAEGIGANGRTYRRKGTCTLIR